MRRALTVALVAAAAFSCSPKNSEVPSAVQISPGRYATVKVGDLPNQDDRSLKKDEPVKPNDKPSTPRRSALTRASIQEEGRQPKNKGAEALEIEKLPSLNLAEVIRNEIDSAAAMRSALELSKHKANDAIASQLSAEHARKRREISGRRVEGEGMIVRIANAPKNRSGFIVTVKTDVADTTIKCYTLDKKDLFLATLTPGDRVRVRGIVTVSPLAFNYCTFSRP